MARAQAMKLIYEWEMGGDGGEETRLNLLEVAPKEREADFMNRMFEGVVVNEAVELANQYSTDKAGGFVNGVLGNLARSIREN